MDFGEIFTVIVNRHFERHNWTNVSTDDVIKWQPLKEYPAISIFFLSCISISIVVGLIGNILVIGAVCVHRKLRTTGNLFIVNLAVADLVVVSIVQPYNIIGIVIGPEHFVYREAVCHVVATVCVMACANSMMTLAAIALNRYIFVCHNKYYNRIYNRCTTPAMCIGLWVLVFLVDLPSYTGWGAHSYDYKSMGCSFDRGTNLSYVLFLSVAIYWVPFFIVFACYVMLYKYVKKNRKELRKTFSRISCNNNTLLTIRREEEIRMIKTFFIVVVVFLICWTPYDLVVIVDRNDAVPMVCYVVLLAIGHSNSSLNSILYAATNRRFRRGYMEFLSYLMCQCTRKEESRFFHSTHRFNNINVSSESNRSNSVSSLNTVLSNKSAKSNKSKLAIDH